MPWRELRVSQTKANGIFWGVRRKRRHAVRHARYAFLKVSDRGQEIGCLPKKHRAQRLASFEVLVLGLQMTG
jgi:hypothetical protein